ncbi:MAG: rRNA maturation RNase YbeY [Bacteroidales bacterium]|jgi:rRNA maturation RNase YbeY|nr:rRNA maturation RNase YbeY [Bacteroidales bacterium]
MNISFCAEDQKFPATLKRTQCKALIQNIIANESKKTLDYINFIACSDEFLLTINNNYLQHDYYTDIITFDYSETTIASDIYISIDRIKENAKELNVSSLQELQRIIIHGVLHLCGYEDATEKQRVKMMEKENQYLNLIKNG